MTVLRTKLNGILGKMTSLVVILFLVNGIYGQDIHFSQYLSSPAMLNPAFTGDFKGDYRLTGNFRNQWNSITVPYRTVGLTVDAAHFLSRPNLGIGLSVYDDLTGDSEYNTTAVVLSGAYAYPLTRDSAQKIHFGLQPSYVLQSLNTSALYFDNQYNDQLGRFDPTLPSGESFSVNSVHWVTMAAGLRYSYQLDARNKLDVGLAGFNLIGSDNTLESASTRLQRRYNFHGNVQFKALQKLDLIPGFLYTSQGKSKNLISGVSGRYLYSASTAIHAGFWYRNRDAGFFTAGLTYQTLYIGLSYDMTTSKLREASNGRGAFELSIIYVFRKFRKIDGKYMTCPNYL